MTRAAEGARRVMLEHWRHISLRSDSLFNREYESCRRGR